MRYLCWALLTEGESDRLFLEPLLRRQLRDTALAYPFDVEIPPPVPVERRTVDADDLVEAEIASLLGDCDLVIMHRDHREAAKAGRLRQRLGTPLGVVLALPRVETEAWAVADRGAFSGLPFARTSALPAKPREAEKVPDPKKLLDHVLSPQAGMDYLPYLGTETALEELIKVPAYAGFVTELVQALDALWNR